MADKYLSIAGLQRLWTKIKAYITTQLATKQNKVSNPTANDILVTDATGQAVDSGTKVSDLDNVFVITNGVTPYQDIYDAWQANKVILWRPSIDATVQYVISRIDLVHDGSLYILALYGVNGGQILQDLVREDDTWGSFGDYDIAITTDIPNMATDTVAGLIKLNPSENVTLNSDGQLNVGGRLGQTAQGGLFYPLTSIPAQGGANSLLLSEAVGLSISSRSLSIAGGNNVTLKVTAAAGATTYEISNTQNNRFICACWAGGRLATSQDGAAEKTVAITSVKFANGNNVTPYFGATEANNNIIITVSESLNPSGTLSTVRGYGKWSSTDTLSVGQGNSSTSGKTLLVGMSLYSNPGGQNQIAMIGNRIYTTKGSCILVGADIINTSQYGAIFGLGHDTTGGPNGLALFGQYSRVDSGTLMAVGNGTSDAVRKNAFEVRSDGIVLLAPNGTRYLVTVSNTGALSATALS